MATDKTANASKIAGASAAYAVAAAQSVAAIPFYGWAMAPGVMAEAYASGMAMMANLSAAGGFDIPSGLNPVTQLHQEEMVLPAELSNKIRNMTDSGGGSGKTEIHIHAMDAASFKTFLERQGTTLNRQLRGQVRDFRPTR